MYFYAFFDHSSYLHGQRRQRCVPWRVTMRKENRFIGIWLGIGHLLRGSLGFLVYAVDVFYYY